MSNNNCTEACNEAVKIRNEFCGTLHTIDSFDSELYAVDCGSEINLVQGCNRKRFNSIFITKAAYPKLIKLMQEALLVNE